MDHIRAHMQTQQKRTHLNTAFLFHRVLLCDESLAFLIIFSESNLSRTPVPLSFINSVAAIVATNAVPVCARVIVHV